MVVGIAAFLGGDGLSPRAIRGLGFVASEFDSWRVCECYGACYVPTLDFRRLHFFWL